MKRAVTLVTIRHLILHTSTTPLLLHHDVSSTGNNILCRPARSKCNGSSQRRQVFGEKYVSCFLNRQFPTHLETVGWSSSKPQNTAFNQYDQNGYGAPPGEVGMKAKLIDLISAVRTLMRSTLNLPIGL